VVVSVRLMTVRTAGRAVMGSPMVRTRPARPGSTASDRKQARRSRPNLRTAAGSSLAAKPDRPLSVRALDKVRKPPGRRADATTGRQLSKLLMATVAAGRKRPRGPKAHQNRQASSVTKADHLAAEIDYRPTIVVDAVAASSKRA